MPHVWTPPLGKSNVAFKNGGEFRKRWGDASTGDQELLLRRQNNSEDSQIGKAAYAALLAGLFTPEARWVPVGCSLLVAEPPPVLLSEDHSVSRMALFICQY